MHCAPSLTGPGYAPLRILADLEGPGRRLVLGQVDPPRYDCDTCQQLREHTIYVNLLRRDTGDVLFHGCWHCFEVHYLTGGRPQVAHPALLGLLRRCVVALTEPTDMQTIDRLVTEVQDVLVRE